MTETKINIEGIINGIGSPYGEGATYEYELEGSSHLDESDQERLKKDLQQLLHSTRLSVLQEVDKIIGSAEQMPRTDEHRLGNEFELRNEFRKELRAKLEELRHE